MNRLLMLLTGSVALLLVGAGCVSAGTNKTTERQPQGQQQAATPTPAPSPATAPADQRPDVPTIFIQNFAFDPPNVTVPVGMTITWTNKDSAPHQLTTDPASGAADLSMPDSDKMSQGQSFKYTFNKPGVWKYICAVHPYMSGSVTVTP